MLPTAYCLLSEVPVAAAEEIEGLLTAFADGRLAVVGNGFKRYERVTLAAAIGGERRTFLVATSSRGSFSLETGAVVPAGVGVVLEATGDLGSRQAAIASARAAPPRASAAEGRHPGASDERLGRPVVSFAARAMASIAAQELEGIFPIFTDCRLIVVGNGFRPNELVTIASDVDGQSQTLTTTADPSGSFRLDTGIVVPSGSRVALEAAGDQGTRQAVITSALTSPLPPPTPPTPTATAAQPTAAQPTATTGPPTATAAPATATPAPPASTPTASPTGAPSVGGPLGTPTTVTTPTRGPPPRIVVALPGAAPPPNNLPLLGNATTAPVEAAVGTALAGLALVLAGALQRWTLGPAGWKRRRSQAVPLRRARA